MAALTINRSHRGLPNRLSGIGLLLLLGLLLAYLPLKMAAGLVVGSILVVLCLHRPKLGLYLLIPAIPFSSLLQLNLGGLNIGPLEGLLALILVSWLLKMSTAQAIVIPHPPLLWPFLLFLAAIGLSWPHSLSVKGSLVETVKWLEMLALYLFISAVGAEEDRPRLLGLLLLAGLAQAGLGIYQFVFKAGPPGFLLFDGRFLRAFGTFNQPNPYAGYLGLILPLALSLSLWGLDRLLARQGETGSLFNILPSLSAALAGVGMLAALFASQSRGAWLGFLAAATVTLLLLGGRWAVYAAAGLTGAALLAALGGVMLLPAAITTRFSDVLAFAGWPDIRTVQVTDANFAIIERLAHWQAALAMWRDHPWFGVGFGNYEVVYPAYAIDPWLDPLGHAHNYLLNLGAETGLVGLLGYLVFWSWVIGLAIVSWRRARPGSLNRALVAGVVGVITHLHIHNLLDNLYVQGMYLHVAIVLSLIPISWSKSP